MSIKTPVSTIKLRVEGGSATPGPPVGPVLGSKGIKAMDFCKWFNDQTKASKGKLFGVKIFQYADKSYDAVLTDTPTPKLILAAAKVNKGSGEPNRNKVASITKEQVEAIAKSKQKDISTFTLAAAIKTIAGTARSMGITIT